MKYSVLRSNVVRIEPALGEEIGDGIGFLVGHVEGVFDAQFDSG